MVSKEVKRYEELTLSVGVLYFFAGGGILGRNCGSLITNLPLALELLPCAPGLGLPLGATDASSDSESSEVAALYSDSSEPASSAAVERAVAIAVAAALVDLRVGTTTSGGGASWLPPLLVPPPPLMPPPPLEWEMWWLHHPLQLSTPLWPPRLP